MIIQGITAALSVGMGCGTCCGTGVSAFLFGYLTTHAKTMKHFFRAFFCFYLGKILAVAGVCLASSLVGRRILDESGSIGGLDLHFWLDLCMIAMGIWFVYKWIREFRHSDCETCHHCSSSAAPEGKFHTLMKRLSGETKGVNYPALTALGAVYGISPCAPLLMMAGYAATLSPLASVLSGSAFAMASALVPMLLLMLLTGILSSKLYKEIPQYISLFRLLSYLLLIGIFTADLF